MRLCAVVVCVLEKGYFSVAISEVEDKCDKNMQTAWKAGRHVIGCWLLIGIVY